MKMTSIISFQLINFPNFERSSSSFV